MDWKLALATGSHLCTKLRAPLVILRFRVAGSNGEVACHSAELTVAEFEVCLDEGPRDCQARCLTDLDESLPP